MREHQSNESICVSQPFERTQHKAKKYEREKVQTKLNAYRLLNYTKTTGKKQEKTPSRRRWYAAFPSFRNIL